MNCTSLELCFKAPSWCCQVFVSICEEDFPCCALCLFCPYYFYKDNKSKSKEPPPPSTSSSSSSSTITMEKLPPYETSRD